MAPFDDGLQEYAAGLGKTPDELTYDELAQLKDRIAEEMVAREALGRELDARIVKLVDESREDT